MTAEEMYRILDTAGVVPGVPYIAATEPWRTALEKIEREIANEHDELEAEYAAELFDRENTIARIESKIEEAISALED